MINSEDLPAGVKRKHSKYLNEDFWLVNVKHTSQARGFGCISRTDFVITEPELLILRTIDEGGMEIAIRSLRSVKAVFGDCDLISHGPQICKKYGSVIKQLVMPGHIEEVVEKKKPQKKMRKY